MRYVNKTIMIRIVIMITIIISITVYSKIIGTRRIMLLQCVTIMCYNECATIDIVDQTAEIEDYPKVK